MAEFIAEWTSTPDEKIQETTLPGKETSHDWIMYFDGDFSLQGAGAGRAESGAGKGGSAHEHEEIQMKNTM